ncbi:signal peptidase I [Acidimicrobiales bacterium]|nr:signal peptidase I [Acidimicrobiales bacterium]MDC1389976.1 signal peptidase I [Acidimicrobiales bacterium]
MSAPVDTSGDEGSGDDTPVEETSADEVSGARRFLRQWGPLVMGTLLIGLLLRSFVVQSYEIPSESMLPTLEDGNRVVVNHLSYQLGEVERGQVVVFDRPPSLDGENDLIKRVIGLPGETIRLVDTNVYIEGLRVIEPYLLVSESTRSKGPIPGCAQPLADANQCVIPEGHVFVMGDNRRGSADSREFGPVGIDTIVGRAVGIVWPPTDLSQL